MIRPIESQLKLAEKIDSLYKNGVKNIVLEAPTGNGKSGIAWFTHEQTKLKACVLSHQKILQNQYHELLKTKIDFTTFKGKNNYICAKYPKLTADIAPCSYSPNFYCNLKRNGACEYYRLKGLSVGCDFLNTNYQLMLSFYDVQVMFDFYKQLYIFDECHNLYDLYTDYRTVRISKLDEKTLLKEKELAEEFEIDDLFSVTTNALDYYKKLQKRLPKITESDIHNILLEISGFKSETNLILADYISKNYKELIETQKIKKIGIYSNFERKSCCKYSNLLDNWEYIENNFVVEKDEGDNFELKIIPLKIGKLFLNDSSNWSDKRLFMSSTIFGAERFIDELGLKNEKYEFISLDTKFPLENRPIYSIPVINLNNKILYDNNSNILTSYFDTIYDIVKEHSEKKESGIIFVPSYKLMNLLLKNLNSKFKKLDIELLYNEDSENRDVIINKFKQNNGKVKLLISPSFFEGVNFNDDYSRYQIIAKVPFKNLASKYVKTRLDMDMIWYNLESAKLIVQACGRSIRSENDYAITYILDGNWKRVFNSCKKYIPAWFNNAVKFI